MMSSGVEFDEDKFNYAPKPQQSASAGPGAFQAPRSSTQIRYPDAGKQPSMVRFLMRHGLAKSAQTAQIYLVAIVIINIIITFIVIKFFL